MCKVSSVGAAIVVVVLAAVINGRSNTLGNLPSGVLDGGSLVSVIHGGVPLSEKTLSLESQQLKSVGIPILNMGELGGVQEIGLVPDKLQAISLGANGLLRARNRLERSLTLRGVAL